ncbi:NlpE-like protein [Flavobacterium araucananum]|uniref:Lipocalin-like domain-containing protein n=1 Tax=Flavobacterium araucananum TaxID=946678 RepID=A0A227P8B4_9FLAO|nr:copper resistance protein NlpE N-terminal domain-containing protein [Flavobacterium araucananum]OXG06190.1 hypothetical protein B0A64_11680 [Flavobacterium araucananum]PWK00587.1 NlpE-like protein [Flavobacterium araucananum]
MKLILTIFLFIFNLTLSAQSSQIVGDYTRSLSEEGKHIIEYKLTLNQDGTFVFHSYSKIQGATPPEVNKYGKGKWNAKDNVITFGSNKKEDFDEKYTLDFNNSKARFVTKNPRDKTDQIVKTRLTFVESGIFWMKKIDIFKI